MDFEVPARAEGRRPGMASGPSPAPFLDDEKALACIHCGLCLNSCPTYLETGNENDSPRGRIYLMRGVQGGRMPLGPTAVRHLDLCLGCRACEAACPSGVQYGQLLEHTREHLERHYRRSLWQRFLRRIAIERVFPYPRRLAWALRPVRWLRAARLEPFLPKSIREAFSLVPRNFRPHDAPELSPATTAPRRGTVGFVQGCVMRVMFGDANAATVHLLNRAGYDVATPPQQVCCGALYAHGGQLDQARACARRNIEAFDSLDTIIVNAAGCGSTLKEYGELLEGDPGWAERARRFSAKVRDLTEFLAADRFEGQGPAPRPVTYHDACHLAHPQRITRQPRDLVRAVAGSGYIELSEADVCCGSAGSYNLTEPEMAGRLQRRKVDHILSTGAEIVVTSNPGCILQIQAGLEKAGAGHIRVLHIAEFLGSVHAMR